MNGQVDNEKYHNHAQDIAKIETMKTVKILKVTVK